MKNARHDQAPTGPVTCLSKPVAQDACDQGANWRLLFLINWRKDGKWDTYQWMRNRVKEIGVLQPWVFNSPFNSLGNRFSRILAEFYLPLLAVKKRVGFDIVLTWSMRMGILYGVLNRLFCNGSSPKHIIYDFHINLIRSDPLYRMRIKLLRMAIPGIDFFLCTSRKEAALYSKMFNILPDRMSFYPIAAPKHYLRDYPFPEKDYIFSYGNSDRDYDTLIEAVGELGVSTVILSQSYVPRKPLPPQVTLITEKRFGLDLIELICAAKLVVLPLKDYLISAGQTAMLETMALGRPLIITANLATLEYAHHLETALFYLPGDSERLKALILLLLANPALAREIGSNARMDFRLNREKRFTTLMSIMASSLYDGHRGKSVDRSPKLSWRCNLKHGATDMQRGGRSRA